MSKKHLSQPDIDDYRRRAMSPGELIAADDHLATCDECYENVRRSEDLNDMVLSLPIDRSVVVNRELDHLRFGQLAAYVDHELDEVDREICDVHLELCKQCAEELRDLQGFKVAMGDSSLQRRSDLSPSPATHTIFSQLRQWSLFQFALTAALAILFIGAFGWSIWRLSRSPQTQLTESPQPSPTVPSAEQALKNQPPSGSPPPSAQNLIALNDAGGQVSLDPKGELHGLQDLTPTQQQSVKAALTTGHLNISSDVTQLRGKTSVLMGGKNEGASFTVLNPVGRVIRTSRPTFRWQSLSGASQYVVSVYDSKLNKVIASEPITRTQWRATQPLSRGNVYIWQVSAIKDGKEIKSPSPPAAEARFKVLDTKIENELKRVESAHATSHLVLGTVYAQAGLVDEAASQFRALLAANPKSAVAQKLLRNVQR
ncbi:MAG: zf-HC2 domain-containing protein [bacterium]